VSHFLGDDPRSTGPADLTDEVTPELLLCTAFVRSGRVDGCGASLMIDFSVRVPLAATDNVFKAAAELQFSVWEGAGPDVVDFGVPVLVPDVRTESDRWPLTTPRIAELPLRALAVLPLYAGQSQIGLFSSYCSQPYHYTADDLRDLTNLAGALGVLAAQRVKNTTSMLPPTNVPIAVGMITARYQTSTADAMAMLRAKAYAADSTVVAIADSMVNGGDWS
jgi:hypothetical protein